MSAANDDWRSLVYAVLVRHEHVLLAGDEEARALPGVELVGDVRGDLARVAQALQVALLRVVDRRRDDDRKEQEVVWELELLEPDWKAPARLDWVSAEALRELSSLREDHRAHASRALDEPAPRERAPWARAGWHAEATAWIERTLAEIGRPVAGRTEQMRVWSLSSLLRVPTASGPVYFKATADLPLFVNEGRVMRFLAELFPAHVPRPLGVDDARSWMLLDDVGPVLGWRAPVEERRAAVELWGQLQAESASHLDELLAAGCIDRRPDWLGREIGLLLQDDASLVGLDDDETARLRSLEPRFHELCRQLAAGPVPDTLAHGDLHAENVGRRDDRYLFFDWSDAAVTHPFLDLVAVVWEEDVDAREAVLDAYLDTWSEYAPADRLRELWRMAEPLLALNQAISYRYIAAGIEPGSTGELAWAIPNWLRRALSSVDHSSQATSTT